MSHGDQVSQLPNGFANFGYSATCKNTIMADKKNKLYGIQFHPEVQHTINGLKILHNFIFNVCKVKADWTMKSFIQTEIAKIKSTVKNDKVLCALSGGVDSAVTASIINKAIGKNLTCLFVDHGLLRKNESDNVVSVFKKHFNKSLIKVDASKVFLNKLAGITDPEQKRKIIGKEFVNTFDKYASKIPNLK
jgi:GMP synthase (glutamine-hydrolysing)